MQMGRVFYDDGGRQTGRGGGTSFDRKPGWYYQIDVGEPLGPYETQLIAGAAARATIVGNAERPGSGSRYAVRTDRIPRHLRGFFVAWIEDAEHPDGTPPPGASCSWHQDLRDASRIAAALNRDIAARAGEMAALQKVWDAQVDRHTQPDGEARQVPFINAEQVL